MNTFKDEPHVSFSQLSTYQMCSLKYRFSYVEQLTPGFTPAALPFGGSVHEAISHFYRQYQSESRKTAVDDIANVFITDWRLRLQSEEVRFDKGQDAASMEKMALGMLQRFCQDIHPGEIIAVEAPFRLRKLDPANGKMLQVPIVGIVDLVEKDREGRVVCADLKTAARKYQASKVAQDIQMSIYSAALKRSKIVNGTSEVNCRFDVLLKTKKPELIQYHTVRNDDHRRRMFKTVNEIILAIDHGIFFPNPGWQCSSCQYSVECKKW